MPRTRAARGKRWTFTLNNYTEEDESVLQELGDIEAQPLSYVLYGREVGESGTPHLQGYFETHSKKTLRSLKALGGPFGRMHLEKANGSLQENQRYCKKDGDFFETGSPMHQGARNDLIEIKEKIDAGATNEDIAEQYFSKWVVYRRSFQVYRGMKVSRRRWTTQVIVIWGTTGTGKTRYCWDQVMDRTAWTPGDYQWFDGYNGQEIVLLDDYRGEYPLAQFLKLTDRYPMTVPIKGGFTQWCPKKIYITSNIHPDEWYDARGASFHAFKRRLNEITEIRDPLYDDIE